MHSALWRPTYASASAMVEIWSHCGVCQVQPPSMYRQGLLAMGAILVRGRGVRWAEVQVRNESLPESVQDF